MIKQRLRPRYLLGLLCILMPIAGIALAAILNQSPISPVTSTTVSAKSNSSGTSKQVPVAPHSTIDTTLATAAKARASARFLTNNSGSYRFEFRYPEPIVQTLSGKTAPSITGIAPQRTATGYLLPIDNRPFVWTNGRPSVRIVEIETGQKTVTALSKFPLTVDDSIVANPLPDLPGFQPSQYISATTSGTYRGIPLAGLTIYPVRYNAANRELLYIKRIVVEISGSGSLHEPSGRPASSGERDYLSRLTGPLSATMNNSLRTGLHASASTFSGTNDNIAHVRIDVNKWGIYRITGAQLASRGVPIGSVIPRTLMMQSEGQVVPIHVDGDEDGQFTAESAIEFFGRPPLPEDTINAPDLTGNRYTSYKAYILSWNGRNGVRMPEVSGQIKTTALGHYFQVTSGPLRVHFEANNYNASLSEVDDETRDRWFWDAGIERNAIRDYPFDLAYPDTLAYTPIRIKVAMHSLTGLQAKHHAYVLLNNISENVLELGRETIQITRYDSTNGSTRTFDSIAYNWGGQELRIIESNSTQGINNTNIRHGQNLISIFSPGDTPTSTATNRIALNWFQVEYLRLTNAYRDELRVGTPRTEHPDTLYDFTFRNFTNPDIHIYRWGSAKVINGTVERYFSPNHTPLYQVHFQDAPGLSTEYYAVTGNRKLAVPDSMFEYIAPDSLVDPPNGGAEYLIIGPKFLLETPQLAELIRIRSQNYNGAMTVDLEKILTRFGQGMFHPKGIRDFLKYAVANWRIPPTTVMLLGDAQSNQQFNPRHGGSLIPHPMMPVSYVGLVGSDTWYSLLDDSYIPSINISRVSARSVQEASDYFDKVLEVEHQQQPQRWQNTISFLRGNGGNGLFEQYDFSHQQMLGPYYDYVNLQINYADSIFYGGRPGVCTNNLKKIFNQGTSLMIYNGHGGGRIWADSGLFRSENVAELQNRGKYPLICNFSCFIVTFNGINQRSTMGEEFIFAPQRGATGVFGTTGLGIVNQGLDFQNQMFQILANDPSISYGQLLTETKSRYVINNGGVINTNSGNSFWATSLLGDPGIHFPGFNSANQTIDNNIVVSDDPLNVTTTLPFSSGTASVRWYRADETSLDVSWTPVEAQFPITSNNFSAQLSVPANYINSANTYGTLRFFFQPSVSALQSDTSVRAVRGYSTIYFRASLRNRELDSLLTDPLPLFSDTVYRVAAKIIDPDSIRQMYFHILWNDATDTIRLSNDSVAATPSRQRGAFWYETPALRSNSARSILRVFVSWVDTLNRRSKSDTFIYSAVTPRAMLRWDNSYLQWNKQDSLVANMLVRNVGNIPSRPTRARMIVRKGTDTIATQYTNLPSVKVYESELVSWAFPYPPGSYYLISNIDIDSVNQLPSDPFSTSIFYPTTTDWWVTSANGSNGVWINPTRNIRVSIPPNAIDRPSGVVTIASTDTLSTLTQQGLRFATYKDVVTRGRGIIVKTDSLTKLSSIRLEMVADEVIGTMIQIHGRTSKGLWQMLPSSADTAGVYHYEGPLYSTFSLIDNQDRTPPRIDFQAEGQIFSEGGYIRRGARFSAMVYDDGGLDLSLPGSVSCIVGRSGSTNADSMTSSELILPEGLSSSKNQPVLVTRHFSAGKFWMKIQVQDLAGNRNSDSINFVVVNDFQLDWVGNFPNPFSKTTTFFYSLTDQTSVPVEISIYTVSGRKIRTLRETDAHVINYRELLWDGRDESGQVVANGVYFYRFIAKNGSKTIEHKGKLAKLR